MTVSPHNGFSLVEAIAALTIFGMAIVVAAGFLDVHMSAARRLEARSDLVRAAETVLESLRGGTLRLRSSRPGSSQSGSRHRPWFGPRTWW
jgi:prepilin-type N-terminal cleavage/methylation domain-containing protein